MPVPLLAESVWGDLRIPYLSTILKSVVCVAVIYFLKLYFQGTRSRSERVMHGKVIMVTGGTSGIGAAVVQALAARGAQIILLTRHDPTDLFLVDYIDDIRASAGSELVYAEQVDLASLHSIRKFATKWVDNAPPRRLDMVIMCANVQTPYWGTSKITSDGLEEEWMVNYLANFHLLSILSPAIRAQPADRNVRIIFSTCNSYIGGTLDLKTTEEEAKSGSQSYARSKLALMTFATAFQQHLDVYVRPDKQPNNARALIVDPGFSRTPGTRRWLSGGSLWGLFLYLVSWPMWWLVLKSPDQGAQSFLYAAMEAEYGQGAGGKMLKECREVEFLRPELKSEEISKKLWQFSEKQIEEVEKVGAVKRALKKKEEEEEERSVNRENSAIANRTTTGTKKKMVDGSRRSKKGK